MHLTDEQIQRYLHDELDDAALAAFARHRGECPACAQAIDNAANEEEAIFDVLRAVDCPVPALDARTLTRPRLVSRPWVRRAAAVILVSALGGAAYALPGSPLPAMLKRAVQLLSHDGGAPPAQTPPRPVLSGVSVAAGDAFTIRFVTEQPGGVVHLARSGDELVAVRARGGTVTFNMNAGELVIDNTASSASYEIDVPLHTSQLRIVVNGQTRMQWVGDNPPAGERDATGRLIVRLDPSSR
jgi:anti-sigma factor RsiW